jgi:hypothetical protein
MHCFCDSRRLPLASTLLLLTSVLSGGAQAEEAYRVTSEITLVDVHIAPAREEKRAQIRFTLENLGAEHITFMGMTVADALQSRIVASVGHGATRALSSIPVAPGDDLSLDGESLWIEVDGLAYDLSAGGRIQATLRLGASAIPISVRVDKESKRVSSTDTLSVHEPTS